MNARYANIRARYGKFLDAINGIVALKLPEEDLETVPASEDPGCERSKANEASPLT